MKFNTDNWKWFKLVSLFDIETGKDLIYYNLEEGNHIVIGHKSENNGITATTVELENYTLYDNTLTISLADRGNFFATIQTQPFYIGTRVKALKAKFKSNINILLFISVLINKEQYRYSYGRNCCDRTGSIQIKLPVTAESKPDWDFIENYIKSNLIPQLPSTAKAIWSNTYNNKSLLDKKISLNIEDWKWFKIDEIFNIKKGERLVQSERIKGNTALITASSENNGLVDYISYQEFIDSKKCFNNKITMDMFCNVFYHNYNYFSDDNVHTLIFKENINNIYVSLFFCHYFTKITI